MQHRFPGKTPVEQPLRYITNLRPGSLNVDLRAQPAIHN